MIITNGLFEHAVLQRDANQRSNTLITGLTDLDASISVEVYDALGTVLDDVALEDLKFTKRDRDYTFQVRLTGIPTGGPYKIILTQNQSHIIQDVLVGDLYVLAGQSNMEGIGNLRDKQTPHTLTRAFYMDGHWDIAEDPLHDLTLAIDPIHKHINGGDFEPRNVHVGTGPGVAFGQLLHEKMGVPIGLIPCAHGGTSMDQWSPEYSDHGGHGLFHMLIHRIKQSGGFINGLFWYQGCSDTDAINAPLYGQKMLRFIQSIREQTSEHLPIVMVQIARMCSHETDSTYWNLVQNEQLKLSQSVSQLALVASIDLEMDDFIHISGRSQNQLGKRAAHAMLHLLNNIGKPQPLLKNVQLQTSDDGWNATLILTYENIEGSLTSHGRPHGFSLTHMGSDVEQNFIYHISCVESTVIIKTTESVIDLSKSLIHYGKGFMPYCNITDGADRALPAFSNVPISKTPLTSLVVKAAWLSSSRHFNKELAQYKDFGYYYLNAPFLFDQHTDALYFHMPFELETSQTLDLSLGGQGAFSIYCDEILIETFTLTQPIRPDQKNCNFYLTAGRHVLSIEYTTNTYPKGLFVRFVTTKDALPLVLLDPLSL